MLFTVAFPIFMDNEPNQPGTLGYTVLGEHTKEIKEVILGELSSELLFVVVHE